MSAKAEALAAKFGQNLASTIALRPSAAAAQASPPAAADRYAGATKSRGFAELPIDAIVRDDSQPRTEFEPEDLRRLAESIGRFGQLSPIRVRPDATPGRWVVLVGERRFRACRLAGLEKIRVEFVEREMTEADILAEQMVENVVRADLLPVEQGRAYRRLMDLNAWTAKDLSEALGVEATAVYRSLALLRLPDDVAERVDAGEIKATAAYEIAKLQIAGDQRSAAAEVLAGNLDHKETVAAVARRRAAAKGRGGRAKSQKLPTARTFRTAGGIRITAERGRGVEPLALVEALREALGQAEAEVEATGMGEDAA